MKINEIKGIGEVRQKSLEEAGIFSSDDLIYYFPYKYYDFSKTEPFCDDGKVRLISATVVQNAKIVKARKNLSFTTCQMIDEVGHKFNAIWYNQTYIKNILFLGNELFLYGKNSPSKKNTFIVSISKTHEKLEHLGLLPVYRAIESVGQKLIHDSINFCLENAKISAVMPNNLLQKYNLMPINEALFQIHNPENEQKLSMANFSIEVENLIPLLAINEFNKNFYKVIKSQHYMNVEQLEESYKNIIPFKLTSSQQNAIYEIERDLKSKFSMNRILQGDVGSGKTVVAFFGCFLSTQNGFQSLFVAPTEILALQHFETAKKFFPDLAKNITLLTGSLSKIERQIALSSIESGEAKIVVGTHSALSDDVKFKNLSFVVIDEQHRFGVEQRAKFKAKGFSPDVLVMSATPIPRTLSLIVYGDLELSTLSSRPKPVNISTNLVSKAKETDLWNYVQNKLETGSKAYVICSKIDEENEDDNVIEYSAKMMFKKLSQKFDRQIVGLIHGKLSKEEQGKIIEKFKNGEIKILVSTTIVEVGMDIPDADLMIIASPERFGLATLHQLRGRIGRNGQESHCFCLSSNLTEKSFERIKFFKDNYNGFEIADFDLKTRGAGSIIGTNQHGNDCGIFSKFSASSLSLSNEILEQIKHDTKLFAKVLEVGKNKLDSINLEKIILN